MTVTAKQKAFLEKTVRETFDRLECDVPYSIEWNGRFRHRLADALWDAKKNRGRLRFSTFVWPFLSIEEQRNTIVHEVCHIVERKYVADMKKMGYNIVSSPHGKRWKKLMIQCGENPSRTWSPDFQTSMKMLKARNLTAVKVRCACKTHEITRNRATRMKNGSAYRCKLCKTKLQFV